MKRRVFYSFHFKPDVWRAAKIRNIGVVDGNRPATDNDWEVVKKGGDQLIRKWISEQMHGRSCTVVLVGEKTAGRKWINYEIIRSWNKGMGVVGIHIHGLMDDRMQITGKGKNPFESIDINGPMKKLSELVRCYDPNGFNSRAVYHWITKHLSNAIEEAISIRNNNRQVSCITM